MSDLKNKEIWIGTSNKGKLSEFKILFDKLMPDIKIHSIAELASYQAPPENGQSFLDNARIKAKSLRAMKPGIWVFAEDSGLSVTGLGGLPGIHSARYAGPKASDSENVAKLLKMMQIRHIADRSAQFICQIVAFGPDSKEYLFEGNLVGKISSAPKGQYGFGYDPIFIPDGETQTLAELGSGYKTGHSHRARACEKLIDLLKEEILN